MPDNIRSRAPIVARGTDPALLAIDASAARFALAAEAQSTRRAYLVALRDFQAWCSDFDLCPVPALPATVERYVADLAERGRAVSTINQRVAAIRYVHRQSGLDSPAETEGVRRVLAGIRRTVGRPPRKKAALTAELVAKVVRKIPAREPRGLRDRAAILLCFGAALRRSELVALDVEDIEWRGQGLLVQVRRSKTDQEGRGRSVAVAEGKLKVGAAVRAWLDAAGITTGPVFRSFDRGALTDQRWTGGGFARALKGRCKAVGLDPRLFSGHSCRRGFATSADEHGADLKAIGDHLGHARLDTTRGYTDAGDKFRRNAGKGFM